MSILQQLHRSQISQQVNSARTGAQYVQAHQHHFDAPAPAQVPQQQQQQQVMHVRNLTQQNLTQQYLWDQAVYEDPDALVRNALKKTRTTWRTYLTTAYLLALVRRHNVAAMRTAIALAVMAMPAWVTCMCWYSGTPASTLEVVRMAGAMLYLVYWPTTECAISRRDVWLALSATLSAAALVFAWLLFHDNVKVRNHLAKTRPRAVCACSRGNPDHNCQGKVACRVTIALEDKRECITGPVTFAYPVYLCKLHAENCKIADANSHAVAKFVMDEASEFREGNTRTALQDLEDDAISA